MELNKESVSYEQAVALKELGFNQVCLLRYCVVTEWEEPTGEIRLQNNDCSISERFLVKAPLKQQVFRWFREKYSLEIILCPDCFNEPSKLLREYKIISIDKSIILDQCTDQKHWIRKGCFVSYEEAESAAIDKLIEIVKQQADGR